MRARECDNTVLERVELEGVKPDALFPGSRIVGRVNTIEVSSVLPRSILFSSPWPVSLPPSTHPLYTHKTHCQLTTESCVSECVLTDREREGGRGREREIQGLCV